MSTKEGLVSSPPSYFFSTTIAHAFHPSASHTLLQPSHLINQSLELSSIHTATHSARQAPTAIMLFLKLTLLPSLLAGLAMVAAVPSAKVGAAYNSSQKESTLTAALLFLC